MRHLSVISVLILSLVSFVPAFALDTVETFDPGFSDAEFYLSAAGLRDRATEATLGMEAVLGGGFTERLSWNVSLSGEGNGWLADGAVAGGFGIFGTPLDTDHVDLDLILGTELAPGDFALVPALELNFDLAPDRERWGMWLLLSQRLAGQNTTPEDAPADGVASYRYAGETSILLGTYVTIREIHQLLLGVDMAVANNPQDDERRFTLGSLALGYNVVLSDVFELISEIALDLPQKGERLTFGAMLGFVATLPGAPS